MITLSFVVIFVAIPLAFWFYMRLRQNRLREIQRQAMERCNCEMAKERAERMRESVEITTQRIDSKEPSDPPVTIETPTDEYPKLPPTAEGKALVCVPIVLALMFGSFQVGGMVRERSLTASQPAARHDSGAASSAPSLDSRLAELRERPTLANVTYFRSRPSSPEVIVAMRAAALSSETDTADAAKVALIRWGE